VYLPALPLRSESGGITHRALRECAVAPTEPRTEEVLSMASNPDVEHPHGADGERRHQVAGPSLAPSALRWWRAFSGDAREIRKVREWLISLLPECPARNDVISVATELGNNAVLHTASGRGGAFAVEITYSESIVRVAVADRGGPAEPRVIEDPDGEHGRGLLLVRGLSERTGVEGDHQGRTVWAEIAWDGPDAASLNAAEAAIREGEDALARCFPGVLVWFGRSTQEWWALVGTDALVTAPTAAELASLLYRMLDAPSSIGHGVGSGPACCDEDRGRSISGSCAAR